MNKEQDEVAFCSPTRVVLRNSPCLPQWAGPRKALNDTTCQSQQVAPNWKNSLVLRFLAKTLMLCYASLRGHYTVCQCPLHSLKQPHNKTHREDDRASSCLQGNPQSILDISFPYSQIPPLKGAIWQCFHLSQGSILLRDTIQSVVTFTLLQRPGDGISQGAKYPSFSEVGQADESLRGGIGIWNPPQDKRSICLLF